MKWNWGTGIALSFVLFCGFVIYVVVRAFQQDVDLVSDTYYKEELNYQQHINDKANLNASGLSVKTNQTTDYLAFNFPSDFKDAQGEIHFYHPSREIFDKHFVLELDSDNIQNVNKSELVKGRYKIKMNWTAGGKSYFQEDEVFVR